MQQSRKLHHLALRSVIIISLQRDLPGSMTIPAYHFRALRSADIEPLQHACWPGQSLGFIGSWLERTLALTVQGKALGLVAVPDQRDDCPIGYGQITCWPRVAEISDLVVAEAWRGQGIGSALIESLVAAAGNWPVPSVEIGVALSNPRALDLYKRLGFTFGRTLTLDLGHGPEPVMYLNKLLEVSNARTEPDVKAQS